MVQEPRLFGLSMPILFALIGSMSVLIVAAVIVVVMLRHDIMGSKSKMPGLASAAEIDAEATRDYQVFLFIENFLSTYLLNDIFINTYKMDKMLRLIRVLSF